MNCIRQTYLGRAKIQYVRRLVRPLGLTFGFALRSLGDGVVSVATPRVAAADSFYGQPTTLEYSPLFDGLNGVGRTGGLVTAFVGAE